MNKKNIVFVYHYFAHYRQPVIDTIDKLFLDEFNVTYIASENSNEPSLKTMDFNKKQSFLKVKNKWYGKWLWQSGLLLKLLSVKPDHIVFLGQFNFITTWLYAILFRCLGKNVLFWGHGLYGNEKGLKKVIRNIFNRLPNKHLVYGNFAKNLLLKNGIKDSDVSVIYNSLNYDLQKSVYLEQNEKSSSDVRSSLFPHSSDLPLGIFVGRLTAVKKLDMIIDCIKILKKEGLNLNFVFIGEGPEYHSLREKVIQHNLVDSIFFYGACHDEVMLGKILYSADVCISPGNVGLTAIHSLSYGTPVITHDNYSLQMPEFEAINDPITGSFYKFGSLESLIEKVKFWLFESNDSHYDNNKCRDVVDNYYNPQAQAKLIYNAIKGLK
ncbi:glycosyltransferase [Vibrio parahaemolyticus]|nr:glycosyltransferase [Vibrio parahaemolyticus]